MTEWGDNAAEVYRCNGTAVDVVFKERDGTSHTLSDCHVGRRALHGFGAGGAVQSASIRTVRVPRTASNVEPDSSWTGTVDGRRFNPGTVTEEAGVWIVEEAV